MIAVLLLVILVDPNQFKPEIKELVSKQTGRELTIDGDIAWQFFPSIGFTTGKMALSNPDGFATKTLVTFDHADISVDVLPLFKHQLNIGSIRLDGASLTFHRLKDGKTNIDNIGEKTEDTKSQSSDTIQEQTTQTENSGTHSWEVAIAGISLTNAQLLFQDDQAGTKHHITNINMALTDFNFGQWSHLSFDLFAQLNEKKIALKGETEFNVTNTLDSIALKQTHLSGSYSDGKTQLEQINLTAETFNLEQNSLFELVLRGKSNEISIDSRSLFSLWVSKNRELIKINALESKNQLSGVALPNKKMSVAIGLNSMFDAKKSHLSIDKFTLSTLDTHLTGKASVQLSNIPKVEFELHSPDLDIDKLVAMSPKKESQTEAANNSSKAPIKEVEPDLTALKSLDVKGDITLDKLKVNKVRMQNLNMHFLIDSGIATLTTFHSDLYNGTIDATATLDARKPVASYQVKKTIKGIHVGSLLNDMMENEFITGVGNITVDASGYSLKPSALKQNLKGEAAINFTDGTVNGINIPLLIRTTYAKIKGEKIKDSAEAKKTDFGKLTADFSFNNGIAKTDNMKLTSPLLRIQGNGSTNYVDESIDMLIKTSIVGTLKGQGGESLDELKNITLPIRVTNSWDSPKFKLELDSALKQKANKELDRGLKKLNEELGIKVENEKVKEAANKLLKGLF